MRYDLRIPTLAILVSIAALLAVGCSTRPDVTEELPLSGNHSSGELTMITSDTTSSGFQYLEPEVSPDLSRIVFTADWQALPASGQAPDPVPMIRQIVLTTNEPQDHPMNLLANSGSKLVSVVAYTYESGTGAEFEQPLNRRDKGNPSWIDDTNLLFWMDTPRGSRLFQAQVPADMSVGDPIQHSMIYRESDDDLIVNWKFWMHRSPAISPNGEWIVFSRFGYQNPDSLNTYTDQQLWVMRLPLFGEEAVEAKPLTYGAAMCDAPAWSPDGTQIVFHAADDISIPDGEEDTYTSDEDYWSVELYTIDFDAADFDADTVILNNNLTRLTYSPPPEGNPIPIRNMFPSYSNDGSALVFVSDRRAPTITLRERNIWMIPADGSLDPAIYFFSRYDDVDASFLPGSNSTIVLSSAMGFPTSLLDELEAESIERLTAENPEWTEVKVLETALSERQELEFFQRVMGHLFIFTPGLE